MVRDLQTKIKSLMDSLNRQIAEKEAEGLFEGEEVTDFDNVET